MKLLLTTATALALLLGTPFAAQASTPRQDLKQFREYFMAKFPGLALNQFGNGVYAIDSDARSSWEDLMNFPPYDDELQHGKKLFHTPFANGKTYASCFAHGGIGIRQHYPYFDSKTDQVVTLELAINDCRVKNHEKRLPWEKGDLADISAYMASTSDGKKMDIKVPNDPRALAWYEEGKRFFYMKRGQLNMSCADCHVYNAGKRIRADTLSPALGHATHFPVYRLKWQNLGTIDRRYGGCNKQVRAKPFPAQSKEYRALEYFESYMSNGIAVNGPALRK